MTDLQAGYKVVNWLLSRRIVATVEPITIRYGDLTATIGCEVVVKILANEIPDDPRD